MIAYRERGVRRTSWQWRAARAAAALVLLASLETPRPGQAQEGPQAPTSAEIGPIPAAPDGQGSDETHAIRLEVRALEQQLAEQSAVRDELLERLKREPRGGFFARLRAAWDRRRDRRRLEAVVANLQRDQALLLERRAGLLALENARAERDWERLEALVAAAADDWREGRAEDPDLGRAIAEAVERTRGEPVAFTFERYTTLVRRLERVNGIILRQESQEAAREAGPTEPGRAPGAAGETPPRPAQAAGAEAPGFLGVTERGLPDALASEASLEAWKRLRATLADEIVSTATEITLRVRSSP